MPSRDRTLCLFGDSHLTCLKLALDDGLVDTSGWNIEFWGADGPRFRQLGMENGRIIAHPDVLERVKLINRAGRESIGPEDFDGILFMAGRLRTLPLFGPRLHRGRQPGGHASAAACRAEVRDWLARKRYYQYAVEFAAAGAAQILFAPTSFPTAGIGPDQLAEWPDAAAATMEDRAAIWADIDAVADADKIIMLSQPEETVVSGCLTVQDFATPNAVEINDPVHRNAAYGALILKAALKALT